MITLTLDLNDTTLDEIAALIDAARILGATAETSVTTDNHVLRIEIPTSATRSAAATSTAESSPNDKPEEPQELITDNHRPDFSPLGDAVRDMVSEEAVRGLLDNLINNRNNRRF